MSLPENERKPISLAFKSNYGTNSPTPPPTPTIPSAPLAHACTIFCLHGKENVELRGHCHRQRSEGIDIKARKKLIIASCLCLFFMVAEIVGGVLSNSLAIATDAAHLLTDFASFMISLFAIWLAGRPSTQRMSFGWYRAEVIGALASVAMIWIITAILVWLAVQRIIHGDYELNAEVMLITSALAIIVNIIMGTQLHSHGHSHGVEPSPPPTSQSEKSIFSNGPALSNTTTISTISTSPALISTTTTEVENIYPSLTAKVAPLSPTSESNGNHSIELSTYQATSTVDGPASSIAVQIVPSLEDNKHHHQNPTSNHGHLHNDGLTTVHPENLNVRAAFIHVLGDMVQSVGVFVAALVIYFKPQWAIADPICTFVFSVIVLFTTFSIMKDALLVLMEGTPSYLHYAEVMGVFLQIEGVERVHNLRIWALSINKIALSAHLAIKTGANANKILQEATTAVHLKYNFFETTIQIEDFTPEMEDCQQCTVPDS